MFTVICIHIGPWKSRKDLLLWECSLFFLELSVRQSMFEGRQARLESSLNRNSFGQIYLGFLIIEMSQYILTEKLNFGQNLIFKYFWPEFSHSDNKFSQDATLGILEYDIIISNKYVANL